ncbi:MAG: RNA polymerase sigma-70 factor [Cyclobacteriaceae bacterium]|nr:RNA polymerase sigma-70 factor [Cyclobacteriaceae bacterium SS2]
MSQKATNSLSIKNLKDRDIETYFEDIYKEYFRRLFAYSLTITKSKVLAQDIVSDVFYNLWNAREELYSIRQLKSYLFTSVKNRSISALSDNPVSFQREDHNDVINAVEKVDPEELMIENELQEFINHSIDKLPPQCQLVFNMVKGQKKSHGEVAKELGITTDTVKYHISSALKKLKKDLEVHFSEAKVIQWIARIVATLIVFDLLKFTL